MPLISTQPSTTKQPGWKSLTAKYQTTNTWKSVWQVANSFIPFVVLWLLMVVSLDVGYWLTLLLSLPAAGFLVRLFIIQHDCGHGSFFKSKKANSIWGFITGVLTFTPYHQWRFKHAVHHATELVQQFFDLHVQQSL